MLLTECVLIAQIILITMLLLTLVLHALMVTVIKEPELDKDLAKIVPHMIYMVMELVMVLLMIIGTILSEMLTISGETVKTIPNSLKKRLVKMLTTLFITDKIKLVYLVQMLEMLSLTELECHVLHVNQTNTGGILLPNVLLVLSKNTGT